MSKYLISVTETYRVDDSAEAELLVAQAKEDTNYELKKYNCENKERKVKGEVEDSWVKVVLTKVFTCEKEPDVQFVASYKNGAF